MSLAAAVSFVEKCESPTELAKLSAAVAERQTALRRGQLEFIEKLDEWANKQLEEDMDDWKKRVKDRVNSLFELVDTKIKPDCRSMYIGRTNCPERRLMQHCKKESDYHMILLHWTPDWSEVMAMEECLIALSAHYAKLENEIGDSTGSIYGNWQCLYLRVQWKLPAQWKLPWKPKTTEIDSLSPDTLSAPFPPLLQQLTCTQLCLKETTNVEKHLKHNEDRINKLKEAPTVIKKRKGGPVE